MDAETPCPACRVKWSPAGDISPNGRLGTACYGGADQIASSSSASPHLVAQPGELPCWLPQSRQRSAGLWQAQGQRSAVAARLHNVSTTQVDSSGLRGTPGDTIDGNNTLAANLLGSEVMRQQQVMDLLPQGFDSRRLQSYLHLSPRVRSARSSCLHDSSMPWAAGGPSGRR